MWSWSRAASFFSGQRIEEKSTSESIHLDDWEPVDQDTMTTTEEVDIPLQKEDAELSVDAFFIVELDDKSKRSLEESFLSHSSFIKNRPPTAYALSVDQFEYDKNKPLGNSSHQVFSGKSRVDNNAHFIKANDNAAMTHCESFMGHLYSLMLLYGVARGYACYDENQKFIAVSSKGLTDFKTFKEAPLSKEQLSNPQFRERFIRILNVFRILREDDGHSGNITVNLQTFDADCALWGGYEEDAQGIKTLLGTVLIKGGRPNVDFVPGIGRDPGLAFNLVNNGDMDKGAYDIAHFPNIKHANPWYFPSRQNYISSYVTTNPWSADEVELVQSLETEETLHICFEQYLEYMFDISKRFPHLAALHFPENMTVPQQEQTIIAMYNKLNERICKEYWQVLPKMPQFNLFLQKCSFKTLLTLLVNCQIRNYRLAKERDAAHPDFAPLFNKAILKPSSIINQFNKLIQIASTHEILSFSRMDTTVLSELSKIKMNNPCVTVSLIAKANHLAKEKIQLEEQNGNEQWDLFTSDLTKTLLSSTQIFRK